MNSIGQSFPGTRGSAIINGLSLSDPSIHEIKTTWPCQCHGNVANARRQTHVGDALWPIGTTRAKRKLSIGRMFVLCTLFKFTRIRVYTRACPYAIRTNTRRLAWQPLHFDQKERTRATRSPKSFKKNQKPLGSRKKIMFILENKQCSLSISRFYLKIFHFEDHSSQLKDTLENERRGSSF